MGKNMHISIDEVKQYVEETDVKFIRLAFCDVFGKSKNIAIMPSELDRALKYGIPVDAASIPGFNVDNDADLMLKPDPSTLSVLPWRSENGRVVRMFCNIVHPDGTPYEADARYILQQVAREADNKGYHFAFGTKMEFYIFKNDENGEPTKIPYDKAGYMDVAPDDKGENLRREICLTLEQMGIQPECSHHEEGPGQNEIDFRYSDAVTAADNATTFLSVVKTIAGRNGLNADFSPKPLQGKPGNGMHINISVDTKDGTDPIDYVIAGILEDISDISVFLNPGTESYERLGTNKAPAYISWSAGNHSQLIHVAPAADSRHRAVLRSADCTMNPYISFALLIASGMRGIENCIQLPQPVDMDLTLAPASVLKKYKRLPGSLTEAKSIALESEFVSSVLPESIINEYCC